MSKKIQTTMAKKAEKQANSSSKHPSEITKSVLALREERKRFLMFVQVLFKYLNKHEPMALLPAKRIIADCTRRNRLGDPVCMPLTTSIEKRLRLVVGESHWNKANGYLSHY